MNLYLGAQESLKGNSNKTMYQISKPIINEDEFESLMSSNDKASIVNKIINASSMGEEEKNVKVVKNKKGKKVTIEPAKWFWLTLDGLLDQAIIKIQYHLRSISSKVEKGFSCPLHRWHCLGLLYRSLASIFEKRKYPTFLRRGFNWQVSSCVLFVYEK